MNQRALLRIVKERTKTVLIVSHGQFSTGKSNHTDLMKWVREMCFQAEVRRNMFMEVIPPLLPLNSGHCSFFPIIDTRRLKHWGWQRS